MSEQRQEKFTKKSRFPIAIPEDLDAFLDELRRREGLSKAALIVRILRERQRQGVPRGTFAAS